MNRLLFKKLKYGCFLFIILILIFNGFLIGNLVSAQLSNIDYEFQNGYAYNGELPETKIGRAHV